MGIKKYPIKKMAFLLSLITGCTLQLTVFTSFSLNKENSISINSISNSISSNETDVWIENLASTPSNRGGFSTAVVNGEVYCFGGYNGTSYLKTVEIYNPITNQWRTGSSMLSPRCDFSSVAVGTKIYILGGWDGISNSNSVDVYDTVSDVWATISTIPSARRYASTELVDGKLYCIGGWDFDTSRVDIYDLSTNSWSRGAQMPTGRYGFTSEVINEKIYCIGGWDGANTFSVVEMYDPKTDSWQTKTNMPTARRYLSSTVIDNEIYCIGGFNGSTMRTLEVYNSNTDSWQIKTNMNTPQEHFQSVPVNNKIYCFGGLNGTSYLNKVSVYVAKESPNATSNVDVYIKPESILSVSLNTNSITFDEFDGIEDMNLSSALEISIDSNLPYDLNSMLMSEIINSDGTKSMNKDILGIKISEDINYQSFSNVGESISLISNVSPSNIKTHKIDIMLKGGIPYEVDTYKTSIKFEIVQK